MAGLLLLIAAVVIMAVLGWHLAVERRAQKARRRREWRYSLHEQGGARRQG